MNTVAPQQSELTLEEIREIFARNRGAAYQLAARRGVSRTMVSQVLNGRATSNRVLQMLRTRALQLVAAERAEAEKKSVEQRQEVA